MIRIWDRRAVGNDDKSRFFSYHRHRSRTLTRLLPDLQLLTRKPCESENACSCLQVEISKRCNQRRDDKDNRIENKCNIDASPRTRFSSTSDTESNSAQKNSMTLVYHSIYSYFIISFHLRGNRLVAPYGSARNTFTHLIWTLFLQLVQSCININCALDTQRDFDLQWIFANLPVLEKILQVILNIVVNFQHKLVVLTA